MSSKCVCACAAFVLAAVPAHVSRYRTPHNLSVGTIHSLEVVHPYFKWRQCFIYCDSCRCVPMNLLCILRIIIIFRIFRWTTAIVTIIDLTNSIVKLANWIFSQQTGRTNVIDKDFYREIQLRSVNWKCIPLSRVPLSSRMVWSLMRKSCSGI